MGVPYFTQRSDCGIWEERALDGARQREMAGEMLENVYVDREYPSRVARGRERL
jgi:hypothetical protein